MGQMMSGKTIGFILLGLLAAGTLWFVIGGLAEQPKKLAGAKDKDGHEVAVQDGEPNGPGSRHVVKREDGLKATTNEETGEKLVIPGQLPALKGVVEPPTAQPTQPHGEMELEGDVAQADAERAVQAVFPAIRDCYSELRQRAPQARGRMLMKFAVKPGADAGQSAMGELFLKETQFTDPKYLTCVRAAIDAGKFPSSKPLTGAVTVPLILSPEDAAPVAPAAGAAPAAAPVPAAAPAAAPTR